VGSHGVEGELKLRLSTDDPDHLRRIKRVYVGDEQAPRRVRGLRFHQGMALLRITGVTSREEAAALRGLPVRIAGSDAKPLAPGEFFYYQIVGITAFDEAGNELGMVTDILETGANDVFVIKRSDGIQDLLLPNVPDVVLEIDPAGKRMVVRPLVYWGSE
jgi:16S rRNA processing protein RimM